MNFSSKKTIFTFGILQLKKLKIVMFYQVLCSFIDYFDSDVGIGGCIIVFSLQNNQNLIPIKLLNFECICIKIRQQQKNY